MTSTRPITAVRALALRGAAVAALVALAPGAQAQDRFTVDASASAGVSTNPYVQGDSSGAALSATLDLHPQYTISQPLTNFVLDGDAQVTFYSRNYSANESFSVNGAGTHRLSERTTINARLGYFNAIAGGVYSAQIPLVPVLAPVAAADASGASAPITTIPVVTTLPTLITDPTLAVAGERRQSYSIGGGIATVLSARNQVSADVTASLSRSGGIGISDFNQFTPSVSWRNQLSENTTLGAGFSVGFIDYLNTAVGDATTYSPQLLFTRRFGDGWVLDASGGVSFVKLHELGGGIRNTQSFSGSATLCRNDTRRNICAFASRQVEPSAFQGVRNQTSVGASLGYRVSERDNLSLSVNYSHADEPLQRNVIGTRDSSVDFIAAAGSYSRRLRPNLSGFVSAAYAKTFDDRIGRGATLSAQAGVTYRFGAPQ